MGCVECDFDAGDTVDVLKFSRLQLHCAAAVPEIDVPVAEHSPGTYTTRMSHRLSPQEVPPNQL